MVGCGFPEILELGKSIAGLGVKWLTGENHSENLERTAGLKEPKKTFAEVDSGRGGNFFIEHTPLHIFH